MRKNEENISVCLNCTMARCRTGMCEKVKSNYKAYALVCNWKTRAGQERVSYVCNIGENRVRTVSNVDSARLYTLKGAKQALQKVTEIVTKKKYEIERVL